MFVWTDEESEIARASLLELVQGHVEKNSPLSKTRTINLVMLIYCFHSSLVIVCSQAS